MRIGDNTRAENVWSIYGSFGQIMGDLHGDSNKYDTEYAGCYVCSTCETDENGVECLQGTVKNVSSQAITVSCLMHKYVFDGGEYEVYTQSNHWHNENAGGWQPLITEVSGQTRSMRSAHGAAPFFVLWNKQSDRGRAFHILADGAWKFSVSIVPAAAWMTNVEVELGINNLNYFVELAPGQEIVMPKILSYEVRNKVDLDCWKIHHYMNQKYPRRELPVIYNTWLCRFEAITFENVANQISLASELGAEYFVIDAGWFGKGNFWNCRGDWEENQTEAFAGRMRELSDLVCGAGMKFGLWLEIESAGKDAKVLKSHGEYYFEYDNMILLDFANPEACDYIYQKVCDLIEKYEVKFIKFDFNQDSKLDPAHAAYQNYYKGYRRVMSLLRKTYPDLYMENCASGGYRMTLDNCMDFDGFWFTDNQSPYEGLRIYKDTLRRIPPQMVERWISVQSMCDFEPKSIYNTHEKIIAANDANWNDVRGVHQDFLEGFVTGGSLGLSCDLNRWSSTLTQKMKSVIEEFKEQREFWKNAVCRILTDTDAMLVLEYSDMKFEEIHIYVFSWKIRQANIRVYPVIDLLASYAVEGREGIFTGQELESKGIDVGLRGNYRMEKVVLNFI